MWIIFDTKGKTASQAVHVYTHTLRVEALFTWLPQSGLSLQAQQSFYLLLAEVELFPQKTCVPSAARCPCGVFQWQTCSLLSDEESTKKNGVVYECVLHFISTFIGSMLILLYPYHFSIASFQTGLTHWLDWSSLPRKKPTFWHFGAG